MGAPVLAGAGVRPPTPKGYECYQMSNQWYLKRVIRWRDEDGEHRIRKYAGPVKRVRG